MLRARHDRSLFQASQATNAILNLGASCVFHTDAVTKVAPQPASRARTFAAQFPHGNPHPDQDRRRAA
jgi:hypothetical protein